MKHTTSKSMASHRLVHIWAVSYVTNGLNQKMQKPFIISVILEPEFIYFVIFTQKNILHRPVLGICQFPI